MASRTLLATSLVDECGRTANQVSAPHTSFPKRFDVVTGPKTFALGRMPIHFSVSRLVAQAWRSTAERFTVKRTSSAVLDVDLCKPINSQ